MPSDVTAGVIKRLGYLVPIVVVLLAIALGVPAILQARRAARNTQTLNNLREIGLGIHNYNEVWQGLPQGGAIEAHAPVTEPR